MDRTVARYVVLVALGIGAGALAAPAGHTAGAPPVADAGSPQLAPANGTIRLDGRLSRDPEGDALTAQWVQTGGPTVSLRDATRLKATFTAPNVTQATLLSFRLTVRDGTQTATDTTTVTVFDDDAGSGRPDLGVAFISRSPKGNIYRVQYTSGMNSIGVPRLVPGTESAPRWPAPGTAMTFTARIVNYGSVAAPAFTYRWYIDDVQVGGGTRASMAAGASADLTLSWTWPGETQDHRVRIEVDPANAIPERFEHNNALDQATNGLAFAIWVEQGQYDRFKTTKNLGGTLAFEDWLQAHFATWHDWLRSAGVKQQVYVDQLFIVPFDPNNLGNWRQAMASFATTTDALGTDGRWQFIADLPTLAEKQAAWASYVATYARQTDNGLIHELMHQLGAIDLYNVGFDEATYANVFVPVPAAQRFTQPDSLMYSTTPPIDAHTAAFLNRSLHQRRGHYGEYLFAVPTTTRVRLLDQAGDPLIGATLKAYQYDEQSRSIPAIPVFTLSPTNANGEALLPNRPANDVTTATGYTQHANPFGPINVVGTNRLLIAEITSDGQTEFAWIDLIEFNQAFWQGQTASFTLPIRTGLPPSTSAPPGGLPVCVFRADGTTSIAGALIQALQGSVIRATGTSDANGIYQFDALADGTYDIRVSKSGFAMTTLRGILVAAGTGPMTEARLPALARVTGIVRDSQSGAAISLASVMLKQSGVTKLSASTSSTGAFTLLNVVPGTYELMITKAGYQTFSRPGTVIGDGATIDDPNLTLDPGVQLTGRVTDAASGAVLVGASVQVKQGGVLKASALTTAAGTYVLATSLPAATYEVVVSKGGYAAFSRSVALPTAITVQDAALEILRLYTVTGTVRDSTGAPVSGATVQIRVSVGPGQVTQTYLSGPTNTAGTYTLINVLHGTYEVLFGVVPSGYQRSTTPVATLIIAPGGPLAVTGPTLTLNRLTHTLTGRVARQNTGAAVGLVGVRLEVDVTPPSTIGSQTRATAPDGSYTFTNVQNGRYRLVVVSVPAADLLVPTAPIAVPELLPTQPMTVTGPAILLAVRPALPDLAPMGIQRLTAGTLTAGQTVQFDSGVRNQGPVASGDFSVRWLVDGQDVNPPAAGAHNPVPANTTVMDGNSQFTWIAQGGRHTISFIVDQGSTVVVQESNETNNTATLTLDVLQAVSTVTGQVRLGDTGAPAAGVIVKLREAITQTDYLTRTTASDGSYTFAPVGAGEFEVVIPVAPAGYLLPIAAVRLAPISAAAPTTVTVPAITLGRALHTLTGRVARQDTGAAVGLVVLRLETPPNPPAAPVSRIVSTAPDGTYTFTSLLNGTYQLVVVSVPAGDLLIPAAPIPVPELLSTNPLRVDGPTISLAVARPHTVAGTVVDAAGAGITGVAIALRRAGTGTSVASTITGAGGAYSFPNVLDGSYTLTLTSVPSGFQNPTMTRTVDLTASTPATMTVPPITLLRALHTLTGRVVRQGSGTPIGLVGLRLETIPDPPATPVTRTAATAPDGSYTIPNLMNGRYQLVVVSVPAGDLVIPSTPIAVPELLATSPATVTGPTVELTARLAVLTGTIRAGSASGQAVNGASLTLAFPGSIGTTRTTDGSGTYRFIDLPANTYTLTVSATGFASQTLTIVVGAADLLRDVVLQPSAHTVRGQVFVTGSTTGPTGVALQLRNTATNATLSAATAANGLFTFSNVLNGTYELRITGGVPAGFRQPTQAFAVGTLTDTSPEPFGGPTVVLARAVHTINGRVLRQGSATGVQGVALRLQDARTDTPVAGQTATTDSGGNFSFTNVPNTNTATNDAYEIAVAQAAGFMIPVPKLIGQVTDTVPDPIDAGAIALFPQGQTVRGTVRAGTTTGAFVPFAAVKVLPGGNPSGTPLGTATTDAAGAYAINGIPDGAYILQADAGTQYFVQSQNITVAGASLVRDFVLITIRPELIPTNLIPPAGTLRAGQQLTFDAGVQNTGGEFARGFTVRWQVDGQNAAGGVHADVPPLSTSLNDPTTVFTWTATTGTHTVAFIIDETNVVPEVSETNNRISATFVVQPPPAFQVTGSVLRTDAIFGPIGNLSVRLDPLGITDMTDSMGVFVFPAVPAGSYTLVAAPAGFVPAQQAVTVTSAAVTQNIMVTPTIDLRPTSLTLLTAAPLIEGQPVRFDSGIQNLGAGNSGGFSIRWKVDGQDVNPAAYGLHNSVPGNTSVLNGNSQFTWASAIVGAHTVTFIVDTDNVIRETDEGNNTISIPVTVQPVLHSVTGLLTRVDSGAGVGGVGLRLRDGITHSDVGSRVTTTAANGIYTFTGVGTGTYELVVQSVPSGAPLALLASPILLPAPITASSAATVQVPEIRLNTTQPDLIPTPIIRLTTGTLVAGQQVRFDSGVFNAGTPTADGFSVRWLVDGQDVVPAATGAHNKPVPGGATVLDGNSQFTWQSAVTGTHTITFIVDSFNASSGGSVAETNESNNTTTLNVIVF